MPVNNALSNEVTDVDLPVYEMLKRAACVSFVAVLPSFSVMNHPSPEPAPGPAC
jgi:hypothetical protein